MNDFLRTRSKYSRDIIKYIFFIPLSGCLVILLVSSDGYSVPFTARINMSFIEGITSLSARSWHLSLSMAITVRTSSSLGIAMRVSRYPPTTPRLSPRIMACGATAALNSSSDARWSTSKLLPPAARRISATEPESMLCDLFISVMWSHISSTDAMLCVENITVAPRSLRPRISSFRRLAFMGSKPENGSSKIKSLGSCTTVDINCTFWAIPFDRSSTLRVHQSAISKRLNHARSLFSASRLSRPFRRAKNTACSPTRIFLYRPRSSGI